MGAAHCMGDDRKQVASIPRNHCSHACYIMIAEKNCTQRKAKTLNEQVHRQVCATNIKRTQAAGKPKKAMQSKKTCRWELRKSLTQNALRQNTTSKRQLFCNLRLVFGLFLLASVPDFEGTGRHAFLLSFKCSWDLSPTAAHVFLCVSVYGANCRPV